jgi:hypothetical protein
VEYDKKRLSGIELGETARGKLETATIYNF